MKNRKGSSILLFSFLTVVFLSLIVAFSALGADNLLGVERDDFQPDNVSDSGLEDYAAIQNASLVNGTITPYENATEWSVTWDAQYSDGGYIVFQGTNAPSTFARETIYTDNGEQFYEQQIDTLLGGQVNHTISTAVWPDPANAGLYTITVGEGTGYFNTDASEVSITDFYLEGQQSPADDINFLTSAVSGLSSEYELIRIVIIFPLTILGTLIVILVARGVN